jgi:hypothetical protein
MAEEKLIQAKAESYPQYLEKAKETHLFYLLWNSSKLCSRR